MPSFFRRLKRTWKRATAGWREAVIDGTPAWVRRAVAAPVSYLDMLLVDHGIFRVIYVNSHRLGQKAWRSAQPAPHQISAFARRGVRTIVNLRGERLCGSYWLEQKACRRNGVRLVNYQVRSRAAPTRDEILGVRDLFNRVEYPILLHCKSGADRAGLMSVLYRLVKEGESVEEAKKELSLRYGHFRHADTGILDYFFERYIEYNKRHPIGFFDWVEKVYDPMELRHSFHANTWSKHFVNLALRRE